MIWIEIQEFLVFGAEQAGSLAVANPAQYLDARAQVVMTRIQCFMAVIVAVVVVCRPNYGISNIIGYEKFYAYMSK